MTHRPALWFPLGLIALLAALSFWLARTVHGPEPKRDGSTRHDPDYIVENFNATRFGLDGLPNYELAAHKMLHYPDDDTTHLEGPHFTQLEKNIAPLHITASNGLVSRDGEHVYFNGSVQVIREARGDDSQLTLTTQYLHITPNLGLAETNKAVLLRDANTTLSGVGLELNTKARVLKLPARVKGRYENH